MPIGSGTLKAGQKTMVGNDRDDWVSEAVSWRDIEEVEASERLPTEEEGV